jgi:UDP-glucose 4-epimerase
LAEETGVDLVLIASEKQHGFARLLHQSADRLLRAFSVPALVFGQPSKIPIAESYACNIPLEPAATTAC